MASRLRVRAFSTTAPSALLKLIKRHRHCNNQPHELAGISRFVFTPSFLRSFSNANRSADSVTNPNPDIPISESDSSDSKYDSDYVSPFWAEISGLLERPREWLLGSHFRYIPCSNRFMRAGNRGLYQLEMGKESIKVTFDMPGIDKKSVYIFFYDGELNVRAVESKPHEGEVAREYATGVKFSEYETHLMKVNDAHAEMKDGVLRVVIPTKSFENRKRVTFFCPHQIKTL